MTRYTDAYGLNVQKILCQATCVIRGPIPAKIREEYMTAAKAEALGHLPPDGLKPEIFFHPNHKHGAKERQDREAKYYSDCIAKFGTSNSEVVTLPNEGFLHPLDNYDILS